MFHRNEYRNRGIYVIHSLPVFYSIGNNSRTEQKNLLEAVFSHVTLIAWRGGFGVEKVWKPA